MMSISVRDVHGRSPHFQVNKGRHSVWYRDILWKGEAETFGCSTWAPYIGVNLTCIYIGVDFNIYIEFCRKNVSFVRNRLLNKPYTFFVFSITFTSNTTRYENRRVTNLLKCPQMSPPTLSK